MFRTTLFMYTVMSLLVSSTLYTESHLPTKPNQDSGKKAPPLTIVLHGTTRTTNAVKSIPFLYDSLSRKLRTPEGLLPIHALDRSYNFYQLAQAISQVDPDNFPLEHFFFFGWSGELCPKARMASGKQLYHHIQTLKKLPTYKDSPITLITHSHGGNVALSLAAHAQKQDTTSLIQRFVLLACPVQDVTEKYLNSFLFKNIISIYTTLDMFQIIDPQGYYDSEATSFFSRRVFKPSSKLNQACVIYRTRSLSHISFIQPWFWKLLPEIIKHAQAHDSVNSSVPVLNLSLLKNRKHRC